jgi:hypothetical protein
MSLSRQATQMPMFAGLPHFCKREAKTPMNAPTPMIPQRVAKTCANLGIGSSSINYFQRQILEKIWIGEGESKKGIR